MMIASNVIDDWCTCELVRTYLTDAIETLLRNSGVDEGGCECEHKELNDEHFDFDLIE